MTSWVPSHNNIWTFASFKLKRSETAVNPFKVPSTVVKHRLGQSTCPEIKWRGRDARVRKCETQKFSTEGCYVARCFETALLSERVLCSNFDRNQSGEVTSGTTMTTWSVRCDWCLIFKQHVWRDLYLKNPSPFREVRVLIWENCSRPTRVDTAERNGRETAASSWSKLTR